ncbi:MAG: hypothetical protein WD069_05360 [Planctomycetales bacterium]
MPRHLLAATPIVLLAVGLVGCSSARQYSAAAKPAEHSRVAATRASRLQGRLANASYAKPALPDHSLASTPLPKLAARGSAAAAKPASGATAEVVPANHSRSLDASTAGGAGDQLDLIRKLNDDAPSVRAVAAFDLGRTEAASPKAAAAIAHRLEIERDPRVRMFLIEGLVRLAPERGGEGLDEIRRTADAGDPRVRTLAGVVLADLTSSAK